MTQLVKVFGWCVRVEPGAAEQDKASEKYIYETKSSYPRIE